MPKVVEHYRDWTPPAAVRASVDRLLASTPDRYLIGLGAVVLTNSGALTGNRRRGKTRSRRRKVALRECRGLYHQAHQGQPASIEVFVDNCVNRLPSRLRGISFLLDLELGSTLFHELGHHLHATQAREYAEAEDVADRWSRELLRPYIRRRYWWLRGVLLPARGFLWLWARLRSRRRLSHIASTVSKRRLTPRCSGPHPGVRPGSAAELIHR